MARQPSNGIRRRTFLTQSAATAGLTLMASRSRAGTGANSKLAYGLIGCGGRGTWIAKLFKQHGGYECVACADYYQDQVDAFGEAFGIPAGRRYTTLSCYKKMLDDGKLDVVVIESPPYFHPEQARAAVDAGKHVYLAKPIAVDVPGCHSIEQSGMKAKENKQVFLIDFQTRNNESYRKAVQLVHEGRIGRLVSGQATYPCGVLRIQAPKTPEERLKYWYNNRAISGDFIVEQSIHTIDVATWITDAHPIRCVGAGGSKGLRSYGENWDHFNCVYWFPEEVVISFNSVQMVHGAPIEIPCRVYGAKGTIDTDYYSHACIWGPEPYEGGKFDNLYTSGTVNNIRDFHKYVTEGVCENETVVPSVRSNLSAIMAREAAYTGKTIQWDELIRDENRLVPDLKGLKA